MEKTTPANESAQRGVVAPHLIVEAFYKDPETGATFVHKDLVKVQDAWAEEVHIGPTEAVEHFGDVESWASYTKKHATADSLFTWNTQGLKTVLDYPDRNDWIADMPFRLTPEMQAWAGIADGRAIPHAKVVEFLDDHAQDIFEPDASSLLTLLRALRASVNTAADVELRADGTSGVKFTKDTKVGGAGSVDLPAEITIAVPVLRGHLDDQGQIVRYKLVLKLRASVGDDARLGLRFVMPLMERVLEQVYAERVASAKEQLGDGYTILRAAG
jgi:hypothetical protein